MVEIGIFKHSKDAVPVAAGEVLFNQGDAGAEMFAVVEGEIDLVRDATTIETVAAGGIFGEMALIDTSPRGASARARTAARVVRVDKNQFTFLVQEHPTFALLVMKVMAERIRRTNAAAPDRAG